MQTDGLCQLDPEGSQLGYGLNTVSILQQI